MAGAHRCINLLVVVARVFPGLGQEPIVPVNVVGVEAQLALLDVLLNGGQLLVCGHLQCNWETVC